MTSRTQGNSAVFSRSHPEWGELEIVDIVETTAVVKYRPPSGFDIVVEVPVTDLDGDFEPETTESDPDLQARQPDTQSPRPNKARHVTLKSRQNFPTSSAHSCFACRIPIVTGWRFPKTNFGSVVLCKRCKDRALEKFDEKKKNRKPPRGRPVPGGRPGSNRKH